MSDEQASDANAPPLVRLAQAMKKPVAAAAIAGGLVLGAVVMVGVAETALGAGAAYLAYRLMRKKKA